MDRHQTVKDKPLEWNENVSNFDITKIKNHACMVNVKQIGNYIHCFDGNHGMRIPQGKILDRVDGQWVLKDMVVLPPQD